MPEELRSDPSGISSDLDLPTVRSGSILVTRAPNHSPPLLRPPPAQNPETVPTSMPTRTFAIGDIHGCDIAFETLLDCLQVTPDDRVVVPG